MAPSLTPLTQRRVVFSFWAVILFVGLPMWWQTTSIYRAKLPIERMLAWSQGSLCEDVASTTVERETRALNYAPSYHVTFSLFAGGPAPSSWDIEAALSSHIQPWISALASTSNFSVTTQVQLFSAFSDSVRTMPDPTTNGSFIHHEDLSAFVNAAEWPLSPSIGSGPTVNFVLYVPRAEQSPLKLWGVDGNAWLIPQWGGICILNPPRVTHQKTGKPSLPDHLSRELLDASFETFTTQFLSLLGVPLASRDGIKTPLEERLHSHTRRTAISLFQRASSTLGSLARLSQSLSSIPIPQKVARLVDDAMDHLEIACQQLRMDDGNKSVLAEALMHAREAYADSEKAFFEKSMVGQVYFPDEHKVAVYLPLLGPIGVPLVVGLVRELKQIFSGLRA
jgi:phosphatidylinositol glycan class S